METVYVETSVVSYLTARPSRDLVVAAHQQITREWWDNVLFGKFEPCISEPVVREISRGDASAARKRLEAVKGMRELPLGDDAVSLAETYCSIFHLPVSARVDALHLAISVLNDVDYLVSWNCTHIANGHVVKLLRKENEKRGLNTPEICTPIELMEG